jgi:hypothetical protein
MQRLAFAVLGVALVVAGAIGWLGLSYLAMPVSTLGVAYVIGARVALTADHVHAIAKGQTPTFEFRRMAQNPSNKYVWQRGKIERPAACLYNEADAGKGAIVRPRSCPDQDRISMSGDQLYFSVESGDALRIGVSNKPLENRTVTNGALYEAEGEIGIGKSTRDAAWFKITLDAEWLNVVDPPGPAEAATDPDWHRCANRSFWAFCHRLLQGCVRSSRRSPGVPCSSCISRAALCNGRSGPIASAAGRCFLA